MYIKKEQIIRLDIWFEINLYNSKKKEVDDKICKIIDKFFNSNIFLKRVNARIEPQMLTGIYTHDKDMILKDCTILVPMYTIKLKKGDIKNVIINKQKKWVNVKIETKVVKNKLNNRTTCPFKIYNKYPSKKMIKNNIEALQHGLYAGGLTYSTKYYKKLGEIELTRIIKVKSKLLKMT